MLWETWLGRVAASAGTVIATNLAVNTRDTGAIVAEFAESNVYCFRTNTGATIPEATRTMDEAGADVVGTNCGNAIKDMIEIVREMRPHTQKPILCQSNAGLPRREGDGYAYDDSPAWMAKQISQMVEAGAQIIGGCCGTTPAHIKVFREAIDAL